ncbi:hypothetical protein A2962_01915 [Candidatus Woesebacteria bacterium RIFCSPLOWO2_01_FULL_39_61]|uniref:Peptidase n=1 Tax=Candidatus Woesebacteria bacterium RIFCSPHIGHO2_02_FULL_39_13 TaxID=1802505 RepID=A0A1F7Z3B8_9BACT|nr:MAG: hypothetical protein A2692_02635 [Candidatus Woesebacteria bacterium RIFCSPHIGHO2_01_FULL_39_95]OGM33265.1 MAG: hypothetical protein A3D01_00555 [Candidatus Woesebacteria bacterium RIFCSPHIGHO2_02_FULL_39_13]OGM38437.1 MAG: hypothetical protein A3E13_00435 [Candidatus Woesebacteria bacterium RIFCSPHIGHO2_12_FULL_40_20]OGM66875.1 MAG: hypothetical protein A2962_01915 [Candidatus Woesebacteria bacterium RIFCSPLOWO2_01_FULL_39_61]OGM75315.1 MAG: hypothetical protein A3H19_02815 [Candidatus
MEKPFIIDLHTDIASNVLEATGKDISRRYSLHEGTPKVPGVVANNNVDLPRLRGGGVKLVFTSIFALDKKSLDELIKIDQKEYNFDKLKGIKFGIEAANEQMSYYQKVFRKYPDQVVNVKTKSDFANSKKTNKVGFLIHLEGVDYIDKDLKVLQKFYDLGARSLALTWRNRNKFGSGNNTQGGLTTTGKKLIKRVRKLGMIFDLAHANEETFWETVKIVDFPIIVSHTLCKALCDNSRNLSDEQIKAVAQKGGVLGMAAIPDYIGGDTLERYVDHFEYIINLVGDDYVAFGTDFDGLVGPEDTFMEGFTGSDGFPNVIKVFQKRGFSQKTVDKICFKNAERIILNNLK